MSAHFLCIQLPLGFVHLKIDLEEFLHRFHESRHHWVTVALDWNRRSTLAICLLKHVPSSLWNLHKI